jgi:two-component system, sensor histidine kinase and response regulator
VQTELPKVVDSDPARLRQIIVNLVGNALKFTTQGEIFVSVEMDHRTETDVHLHFTVSDTGIAISPEQQLEIFKPFTQADGSTTRKFGGTGLGLTICLRLVEMMGGRVWIDSKPGTGSKFHFTIQCGVPEQLPEALVPQRCVSFDGLRVLIVDDNSTDPE